MRGWWFDVDGVAALRHQVARVDADLSVWCARVGDPMAGGLAMAVRSLRDRLRGDWVSMIDAVAARLGDVVVAAHSPVSYDDPDDSGPFDLICRHGSLTSDEMLVPLVGARGRR